MAHVAEIEVAVPSPPSEAMPPVSLPRPDVAEMAESELTPLERCWKGYRLSEGLFWASRALNGHEVLPGAVPDEVLVPRVTTESAEYGAVLVFRLNGEEFVRNLSKDHACGHRDVMLSFLAELERAGVEGTIETLGGAVLLQDGPEAVSIRFQSGDFGMCDKLKLVELIERYVPGLRAWVGD